MRRLHSKSCYVMFLTGLFSIALILATGGSTPETEAPPATAATVFEGARLIVGDGSQPIEDAVFIVENDRFTAVGRRGQLEVPEGATRVDLTGKTVMPAIIDTHKHLAKTRQETVDQLQHLAYYGVGVAMSLGHDVGELSQRDVDFQNVLAGIGAGHALSVLFVAAGDGRTIFAFALSDATGAILSVAEMRYIQVGQRDAHQISAFAADHFVVRDIFAQILTNLATHNVAESPLVPFDFHCHGLRLIP